MGSAPEHCETWRIKYKDVEHAETKTHLREAPYTR